MSIELRRERRAGTYGELREFKGSFLLPDDDVDARRLDELGLLTPPELALAFRLGEDDLAALEEPGVVEVGEEGAHVTFRFGLRGRKKGR